MALQSGQRDGSGPAATTAEAILFFGGGNGKATGREICRSSKKLRTCSHFCALKLVWLVMARRTTPIRCSPRCADSGRREVLNLSQDSFSPARRQTVAVRNDGRMYSSAYVPTTMSMMSAIKSSIVSMSCSCSAAETVFFIAISIALFQAHQSRTRRSARARMRSFCPRIAQSWKSRVMGIIVW